MTSRRLKGLSEEAARLQEQITTLEKVVQLKENTSHINDSTFAQQKLFPGSLDLWRKIVAAQIQLYKVREKEKELRKQIEKDQNRIVDFSILNKYRRFRKHQKEEKQEDTDDEEQEENERDKQPGDPPGFMIRFRLSNAYEAIQRQEQVLTRPKLVPFIEKSTKSGPIYFYFDREVKKWKRFYPDADSKETEKYRRRSSSRNPVRVIDGRGLPFFMQQTINRINAKKDRTQQSFPSISLSSPTVRKPSVSTIYEGKLSSQDSRSRRASASAQAFSTSSGMLTGARSILSSGKSRTRSGSATIHNILEESQEALSDLNQSKFESSLGNPDDITEDNLFLDPVEDKKKVQLSSFTGEDVQDTTAHRPGSKKEKKKVERLKKVSVQMSVLQEELKNTVKDDNDDGDVVDDDDEFKASRFLYRMPHCKCVGKHSDLVPQEIKQQVAGTIDILDHTSEGGGVGTVDCVYCMAPPREHIHNWLMSLQTGHTQGVYGNSRHNWFPKVQRK